MALLPDCIGGALGVPEGGGQLPLLTKGARGAVLPLAFHWDSSKVKRLLCSIAKISV